MPELELLDYGGGNLASLQRCLERLELPYVLTASPSGERPVVLPGVGAFGAVMGALEPSRARLCEVVRAGTPFLGICVGLQVLLSSSEESPGAVGLGLVSGSVRKFAARKVPQMGWNRIWGDGREGFVYFVNSYHAVPDDPSAVWMRADYEGEFCAALRVGNIAAFQFHPEKSGDFGHALVREWAATAG